MVALLLRPLKNTCDDDDDDDDDDDNSKSRGRNFIKFGK